MSGDKNEFRAPWRPLDVRTLALSVGGLGFLRPAPGTWGSLPPVLIAAAMTARDAGTPALQAVIASLLGLGCLACVLWGGYAEQRFGRKDAAEVVADETAGVCVPLIAAVWTFDDNAERLAALAVAFVLFRLFDIFKPWPARRLERLPAGWGVLLDDLAAGAYAALALLAGAAVLSRA